MRRPISLLTLCVLAVSLVGVNLCETQSKSLGVPVPEEGKETQLLSGSINPPNVQPLVKIMRNDYLAELIYLILGVPAPVFLKSIDAKVRQTKVELDFAIGAIRNILNNFDAKDSRAGGVVENALKQLQDVETLIKPIIDDFSRLLPSITPRAMTITRKATISDVIRAILQISFEQFLTNIGSTLDTSFGTLTQAMGDLVMVSSDLSSDNSYVSTQLNNIVADHLRTAREHIRLILHDLDRILFRQ